jgi:hypothetical protein
MKTIIFPIASAFILTASFLEVKAQKAEELMPLNKFEKDAARITPETKEDERIVYKVNIKAVRDFMKTYNNISNEKWKILEDGYVVSFADNLKIKKIFYDKKGSFLYTVDYYPETELPKDVRGAVKSLYHDYSIAIIREINFDKRNQTPIYIIHVKKDSSFKTVRFSEGKILESTP